jgi:lipid-A-disaccharide synthase
MPPPRSNSRSKSPSESRRVIEKIYFVAGEASGDNHGAALIQALRARSPQLRFTGRGGPKMRVAAGQDFRDWIDEAAVVGLWEVVKRYKFFGEQFRRTISEVESANPAAVVLIDYPGFNLRLARALRKRSPSLKIIYYISPQVWAWNRQRIRQMKRWIDLILCIFPFEPDLYNEAGLRAIFVGHPMAVELQKTDIGRDSGLVGLFPGSRQREVQKIFPIMRKAAIDLMQISPDLHFEVAAASEPLARIVRAKVGQDLKRFSVTVGHARSLMRRASVGMVASGTATLEAALFGMPFVLVYRVAWLTYFAARLVVKIKHLGMPNVLAKREIVPEFIQHRARPRQIAATVAHLLSDEPERARMLRDFHSIAQKLGQGETSGNAAEAILAEFHR